MAFIFLFRRNKNWKTGICKYDGCTLHPNNTGSLVCPKCKQLYYEDEDGNLMEKL